MNHIKQILRNETAQNTRKFVISLSALKFGLNTFIVFDICKYTLLVFIVLQLRIFYLIIVKRKYSQLKDRYIKTQNKLFMFIC